MSAAPFTDAAQVASYAQRTERLVPGLHDLHRMACVLLAEGAGDEARLLVLGAGGGLELKAFARMQPTWQFDGVDPSAPMLELARETLGPLAARVRWHEGLIDCAPPGPFDGASCLLTLHFLPPAERLQTLRALHARLRPGARLVMAQHSFDAQGPEAERWLRRNAAFADPSGRAPSDAGQSIANMRQHLPALTPAQDLELMTQAGFAEIELFYSAFSFKGWVATKP